MQEYPQREADNAEPDLATDEGDRDAAEQRAYEHAAKNQATPSDEGDHDIGGG